MGIISPQRDLHGRTYYIDGAGNWGFGVSSVHRGLARAGYQGNILNYRWSPTLNPALDQTIGRPAARLSGRHLGREISAYLDKQPGRPVNIIALSAGTGVAIWACEELRPGHQVDNVILLGSSLSSEYDMGKALQHVAGGVYVYHSTADAILQGPVRMLGTIDGKVGVESAGLVGLQPESGRSEKIHNIGWTQRYERYGWRGSHTGATSEVFVRTMLAKHVVTPRYAAADRERLNASSEVSDDPFIPFEDTAGLAAFSE